MTLLSDPNASAIGRGLPDNGDEWNPTHPVNVAKKWAAATETNDVESLLALAHPQIASHNDSNVVNGRLLLTGRAEVLHQREKHPPPYRPLKDWVNCTNDPSYLVQELAPSSGGQVVKTLFVCFLLRKSSESMLQKPHLAFALPSLSHCCLFLQNTRTRVSVSLPLSISLGCFLLSSNRAPATIHGRIS